MHCIYYFVLWIYFEIIIYYWIFIHACFFIYSYDIVDANIFLYGLYSGVQQHNWMICPLWSPTFNFYSEIKLTKVLHMATGSSCTKRIELSCVK